MADPKEIDYVNMSDEDFLNAPPPDLTALAADAGTDDAGQGEGEGTDEGAAGDAGGEGEGSDTEGQGEGEGEGGEKQPDGEGEGDADADGGTPAKEGEADPEKKPDTEAKDGKEPAKEEPKVDYEAEHKRLLAPFKANGREIQVKSVDDAIALMQMGANYNKKMAGLKPNLKLLKLLENNGLLSEDRIGFLIDVSKKDPTAISKLVKDSGIDPMDLDAEKASAYKPTTRTVDDREIDLDNVLTDLEGSQAYTRTLEIVGTKWDAASKRTVADNPELMRVIHDHVDRGFYDLIAAELESERTFGRLKGLSDIEAYKQVGDAIHARGGFKHLENPGAKKTKAPVIVEPKPSKAEDDKLKDKRRAASSTKPAAPKSSGLPKDFNPLAMSDEEFSKHADSKFL